MKNKLFILIFFEILTVFAAKSQASDADSIFVNLDSSFMNIVDEMQKNTVYAKISINQSSEISDALQQHVDKNFNNQHLAGYRICIFRDNQQNSRTAALQTKQNFQTTYPDVPVYWEYKNPYFYVNVGDFRTKQQAEKFKREINSIYPKSWIVSETKINLPSL